MLCAMSDLTIRVAYPKWPQYNRQLRGVVAGLTEEQLANQPTPERWPLWATIGHLACQRVFGLCDVAGEPGAETTPVHERRRTTARATATSEHVLGATDLVGRSTRRSASSREPGPLDPGDARAR